MGPRFGFRFEFGFGFGFGFAFRFGLRLGLEFAFDFGLRTRNTHNRNACIHDTNRFCRFVSVHDRHLVEIRFDSKARFDSIPSQFSIRFESIPIFESRWFKN